MRRLMSVIASGRIDLKPLVMSGSLWAMPLWQSMQVWLLENDWCITAGEMAAG